MARDLYIDTDSRQFVEGFNNAAVKIQGPYFKGDTETLNLYFLQRTGVIGTPYAYTDKSSSTAKVSWGTVGQSSILSVTGFSAIDQTISVGVTISQAANSSVSSNLKNQIQKVIFNKIPLDGVYNLVTGTTGITASFNSGSYNIGNQLAVLNGQNLLFSGITGATCDGLVNSVNPAVLSGSNFTYGNGSYDYYNGKITFTKSGVSYTKKIVIKTGASDISYASVEDTNIFPVLGTSVVINSLVGVSGVTSGNTYYISRANLTNRSFAITGTTSSLPVVLALARTDGGSQDYAITGVTGSRVSFRKYDSNLGVISGDVEFAMDANLTFGRVIFSQIVNLTGITSGTTYHINTTRDTVSDGYYSLYEGDSWGQADADPRVTPISTSGGNVLDPGTSASSISNFTAANPVYSFQTISESTVDIAYAEDVKTIQGKLEALPSIGSGNVSLIKNLDGSLSITFIGSRGLANMPLLSVNSRLTSAPGLTATVGITSAAITTLLSGTTSAPVTLEVELTTSGNKLTAAQGDATLAVALSH